MMICCCSLAGTAACDTCMNKKPNTTGGISTTTFIDFKSILNAPNKKKAKPVIQYWCSECDAVIDKYARFCHNCGTEIDWGLDKLTLDN